MTARHDAARRWRGGPLGLDMEAPFGRILEVARLSLGVPMAGVGLMDGAVERFVARRGPLPEEAPREETLCDVALRAGAPLRIADAAADPVLARLPTVAGPPGLRGYMAVPLAPPHEGTLCVADTRPRAFSEADMRLLAALAHLVDGEIGLRHVALTDALTGLMSRGAWMGAATRAAARAARGEDWCVVLIDVDRFKEINDTHGHAAGDAVLQETARRASTAVRGGDAVGRIGGDEIAVLARGDAALAERLAGRLAATIGGAPVAHGDRTLPVSASVGAAALGPHGLDEALEEADIDLYRRKAGRRAA